MLTNRKLYFFLNVKELHEKIATFTLPLPLPSRFFQKKKKKIGLNFYFHIFSF